MDVFNQDAFSLVTMTSALDKVEVVPQRLGMLDLFAPRPVRTETVSVEQRDGVLTLIPASNRGAPLDQRTTEKRNIRDFRSVRLAKGDRIMAAELQNIRAFGTDSELMQVMAEVGRRLNGPAGLLADLETTKEHMRLGAIQGIVLDADGSTELFNWYTEFGITAATEIDFDLDNASPASGAVRKKCNQVIRQMQRAAKGAWGPSTQVYALCGDNFWDDLTAHPEIRGTYLQTIQAQDLRNDVGLPFERFRYGGIWWENYKGTDDNSTVAIGTDKAKFFPVNAPGVFEMAYSPAEFMPFVNTPGRDMYAMTIPDEKRQAWVDIEVYCYPLPICTRPEMLQSGRRT
jgi:hypothetical protein